MQGIDLHRHSGNRRVTLASMRASQTSRKFRTGDLNSDQLVSRTMALQVAKRAASAMGLKSAKLALIDQLFAFSKTQDWISPGIAPVVWPSNELLARQLGVSISTMKHHLKGLVEAGLVSYSDHPTFQRKGIRDEAGNIVKAFGIDLSPLSVDYHHLLEISEAAETDARRRHDLRYRRTGLRREIDAIIYAAQRRQEIPEETWGIFQVRLCELRDRKLSDNQEREINIGDLEALRAEVEQAFEALCEGRNIDSALTKFRPLQITADLPDPDSCEAVRHCTVVQSVVPVASGEFAFDKKREETARSAQAANRAADIEAISIALIREACPEVALSFPGVFEHWSILRRSGIELCRLTSINPQVYREAQDHLGLDLAVTALALTVERTVRGEVLNPGGYLRTLTQRGRDGELRLSSSLFALARQSNRQANLI